MNTDAPVMGRRTRSIPEAARLVGMSRTRAYQLVADGTIPVIIIGKRKLVPVKWIAEVLNEHPDTLI